MDNSGDMETRRYSNGTKDDYRSLLALKTPDYQNMPVADFNSALLTWASEDYERMDRIDEDIKWNDFPVTAWLPKERDSVVSELQFACDTVSEEEMAEYRRNLESLG